MLRVPAGGDAAADENAKLVRRNLELGVVGGAFCWW